MEYRTLTNLRGEELTVSAVGVGCNNFGRRCDAAETGDVVAAALDQGITLFDTSDSYGLEPGSSETYLGRALAARRKDVVIATKFGWGGGASAARVAASAEASLRRLGTDYVDLYQLHKPDPATPIEETLGALDRLVRDGKVRFIGCSNLTGSALESALAAARERETAAFVTAQNRYSLLNRDIERDLVPVCLAHGVGILPFYPLESGLLTGKYRRDAVPDPDWRLAEDSRRARRARQDADFDRIERLSALAQQHGRSLLELAMSWTASQPAIVSVIAGARTADQVRANVAAAGWSMAPEDRAAIDDITLGG